MQAADSIHTTTAYRFVGTARQGHHTAPQAMLDLYDELEQIKNEGMQTRDWGKRVWVDKRAEQRAEDVASRLTRMSVHGGKNTLISEHLQPAFDQLVERFRADRAAAGRHADSPGPSLDMLEEGDKTRKAIIRVHSMQLHYGILRTRWEDVRGPEDGGYGGPKGDPLGVKSPLAECRNLPELVPHWRTAGQPAQFKTQSWPWRSTALHIKLGWLLDHGGELWLPTKQQQDQLWRRLEDKPQRAAA